MRAVTFAWIAALCLLYSIHLLHLQADFPNFSPWMDYSKYTDEGWYGSGAVRHFLGGSWRLPGDFNPAAALPIWPVLEALVFHFTGVSLAAARTLVVAVFGGNLLLLYSLLRTQHPRLIALLGVTIAAACAFLYAFSRLAILEPLLIFWTLLSWRLALSLPDAASRAKRLSLLIAIGLLICLSVLTKTTGIFLIPAVFYLIWRAADFRPAKFARYAIASIAAAALPWLAYFLVFVRPHALSDYQYLFAANETISPSSMTGKLAAFWYALHGILWIDVSLGLLAAVFFILSAIWLRRLWRNPIFVASLIATAGYVFFIGWHNNMQPRYYQVVAFPLILLVCAGTASLLRQRGWAGFAALAAIVLGIGLNLRLTMHFVRHPEYTFVTAAQNLTNYIDQHPNGNRLLLSISGANITLATHLPSICDDYGTWDLPYRIHTYKPGWYAAWNEMDPGTLEDLETQYSAQKVAQFPAFDDEDRNLLILYKLNPLPLEKQAYQPLAEEKANAGK